MGVQSGKAMQVVLQNLSLDLEKLWLKIGLIKLLWYTLHLEVEFNRIALRHWLPPHI